MRISSAWKRLLSAEFSKPYFANLTNAVRKEYLSQSVFPHPSNIFRAFDLVPPENVRVVILGQDPYHTPGVANGLAFSTQRGNAIPPSLQNIFKELRAEGYETRSDPELERWATQGVLLLNASLSVRSGAANSHSELGWHEFTDAVISSLSANQTHIVFMLWGSFAGSKQALIDRSKHLILISPHPSPLSAHRGFFGNGHFKRANEYLKTHERGEIDWR